MHKLDTKTIVAISVTISVVILAAVGYLFYHHKKYSEANNLWDFEDFGTRLQSVVAHNFVDESVLIPSSEIDLKERVGRGSFGDVYRALWRQSEVAVKKVALATEDVFLELMREAKLMLYVSFYPNAHVLGI